MIRMRGEGASFPAVATYLARKHKKPVKIGESQGYYSLCDVWMLHREASAGYPMIPPRSSQADWIGVQPAAGGSDVPAPTPEMGGQRRITGGSWKSQRFPTPLATQSQTRPLKPLPTTPHPGTGCNPADWPRSAGSAGSLPPSDVGLQSPPAPNLAEDTPATWWRSPLGLQNYGPWLHTPPSLAEPTLPASAG